MLLSMSVGSERALLATVASEVAELGVQKNIRAWHSPAANYLQRCRTSPRATCRKRIPPAPAVLAAVAHAEWADYARGSARPTWPRCAATGCPTRPMACGAGRAKPRRRRVQGLRCCGNEPMSHGTALQTAVCDVCTCCRGCMRGTCCCAEVDCAVGERGRVGEGCWGWALLLSPRRVVDRFVSRADSSGGVARVGRGCPRYKRGVARWTLFSFRIFWVRPSSNRSLKETWGGTLSGAAAHFRESLTLSLRVADGHCRTAFDTQVYFGRPREGLGRRARSTSF